MLKIILLLVLGLVASQLSFAAEGQLKSWYVDLGLGYAGPSYSSNGTVQSFANQQKNNGFTDTPLSIEISFYWPVGKQVLLGVADTGFADSFSNPSSGGTAGIVASNLLASAQYFPFTEDASWLFARLDAGFGMVGTSTGFGFFPSSYSSGLALHGGLGVAIPIGGTRIPILAGYYYEGVSAGAVTASQIAVSVMW